MVCSQFFNSSFWEQDLIRKITHDFYQDTQENLPSSRQLGLRSKSRRKMYETIMLMDLHVIEKNRLLKSTDLRGLSRMYNFLRTKRGIRGSGPREKVEKENDGKEKEENKCIKLSIPSFQERHKRAGKEGEKGQSSEDPNDQITKLAQDPVVLKIPLAIPENHTKAKDSIKICDVAAFNSVNQKSRAELNREKELESWESKIFREIQGFRFKETKKHKLEQMPWKRQVEQIRLRVRVINCWREFQEMASKRRESKAEEREESGHGETADKIENQISNEQKMISGRVPDLITSNAIIENVPNKGFKAAEMPGISLGGDKFPTEMPVLVNSCIKAFFQTNLNKQVTEEEETKSDSLQGGSEQSDSKKQNLQKYLKRHHKNI